MPGWRCGVLVCAALLTVIRKSVAEDHCGVAVFLFWLFILSVPLSLSFYPSESSESTIYGGNSRARKAAVRVKLLQERSHDCAPWL